MNDKPVRERVQAATKCDLERDTGYTKAGTYFKHSAYLCIHFIRGCCAEGANCRFFHHVPEIKKCQEIENVKDVFGRERHANFREDMGGVGSFKKKKNIVGEWIKNPARRKPGGNFKWNVMKTLLTMRENRGNNCHTFTLFGFCEICKSVLCWNCQRSYVK